MTVVNKVGPVAGILDRCVLASDRRTLDTVCRVRRKLLHELSITGPTVDSLHLMCDYIKTTGSYHVPRLRYGGRQEMVSHKLPARVRHLHRQ